MLKPYNGYKETNIPWLEEVPAQWDIRRLYSIAQEKSIINNQNEELLSVYLNLGVVSYRDTSQKQVHKPSEDRSKYQLVEIGDIVLNNQQAWRGSVGVSKYRGIVSPAYYVLQLTENYNASFMNYLIRNNSIVEQFVLSSKGVGSIQRTLYTPYLKNVLLAIPPQEEQNQIVKYLDWQTSKINTLIKVKKKQIELLKEQKQAVINKAVTKGLDDTIPMKDSGIEWLGKVPEHWTIRNLGSFASLQNGISESGDFFTKGFPFVNYGDVYNNYALPKEVDGLANSNKKQQEVYSIIEGDILFTRTSETKEDIARSCVAICTIENAVFSGFVIRVRPISNTILTGYSKFYFRNELLRNYFVKEMNIVTRASLSQGVLRSLPVMLPSLEEQQAIVTYLEEKTALIEKAIAVIEKEIELVSEYKTSLISSVVTGRVDVRDVVVPNFEVVEEVDENIENDVEEMEG